MQSLSAGQTIPVIKGFFYFTLVYNRGAAFGILRNQIPFFYPGHIYRDFFIFFHLKRSSAFEKAALGLILAGRDRQSDRPHILRPRDRFY